MSRIFVVVWFSKAFVVPALALIVISGLLAMTLLRTSFEATSSLADAVCGKVIAIDPGHGGTDPGAIGRGGLTEKDLVLDIAKRLAALMNRVAIYTVLTREGDRTLAGGQDADIAYWKREDLDKRIEAARNAHADLFISIHANSFPEPMWSGAQTFYHSKSGDSKHLASAIQEQVVARLGPNLRKIKPGDSYYILRTATMPAVIVEVGFLSNPREEAMLGDPDYRQRMAEAIFHGTVEYLVEKYRSEKSARESHLKPPGEAATGGGSLKTTDLTLRAEEGEMILYFGGPTNFDDSLMPEIRKAPGDYSRADLRRKAICIVRELISGPAGESVLSPTIPKGTSLRDLWITPDGVAHVDFSSGLSKNHWGGSRSEELTVYSIVNSLTELPDIKKVQILIEGRKGSTIAGHIILDTPLGRDEGLIEARK
ncbi:MAG TPA: hypothetical protein GXX51_02085 [Firmicutes bacterium]|nr:hypothetical protein [Bacillota bacterium]